ncbi:hypothetical protein [Pelagicoccus albus]|uniref:Uncharacterized protein n=1 Tax=Pelagicoccus albus TaxID=415222 RepID=A0A7X1B8Z0_9BACT|nr:hypothetical protein [Pelagicoccus albus]MBC2607889.1 hypothetical protein [Pelagicoccus albus]
MDPTESELHSYVKVALKLNGLNLPDADFAETLRNFELLASHAKNFTSMQTQDTDEIALKFEAGKGFGSV